MTYSGDLKTHYCLNEDCALSPGTLVVSKEIRL